jgi:hypothetical protein
MSRATDFNLNRQCLLNIPMFEGVGAVSVKDDAGPHHPMLLTHAPTWTQLPSGLWVLAIDGVNDYASCLAASSTDLNFIAGDFSGALWVKVTFPIVTAVCTFFCRGRYQVDGWHFCIDNTAFRFFTYQPGANKQTYAMGVLVATEWHLYGFTRAGASLRLYYDGKDRVDYMDTMTNPTTSARNFYLGIHDGASGLDWSAASQLGIPRVWGRALSPVEHMQMFNAEREFFGV